MRRAEKTLVLYIKKMNARQQDLQPCLQMTQYYFCHGVVLKIHSVVEIQIQASFATKMKTVDGL